MGGGLSVRNKTDLPIVFQLKQVGPLHWVVIPPHETRKIDCGQVWFTAHAFVYDGSNEPTGWDVALPIVICTGAALLAATGAGAAALTPAAGVATGAGSAAAALAPIATSPAITFLTSAVGAGFVTAAAAVGEETLRSSIEPVSRGGLYTRGQTIEVCGGLDINDPKSTRPMRFSGPWS